MLKKSLYTMLLIFDDTHLGKKIANLVSGFGYTVQYASNDRDVSFLLGEGNIDFVLTDFSYDVLTTKGIVASLGTNNENGEFIVFGAPQGYLDGLEGGALDYVFLPLVDVELELKLQRACRECELKRDLALVGGIDKETGLGDEVAFSKAYAREVERTLRQDSSMHVVMVSLLETVDIAQVIEILEESIRGGVDTLFCLKDRTFSLILAETTADQATEIIQRAFLKSLERGLGLGALAIGCALCQREEGKSYSEIERDSLKKAQEAVLQSRKEGGHAAVYSR